MPLANFNMVLLGESFPVSTIKVSDFTFRHRPMREKLRLPVAIQAEAADATLQLLPDRFEVGIVRPDNLDVQCDGLEDMVQTFFEYAGRRTIKAVGHNAQWVLLGTSNRKRALMKGLLAESSIEDLLGTDDFTAEINVYFPHRESRCRLLVTPEAGEDLLLDFNFHFDAGVLKIDEAVGRLRDSLTKVTGLSERVGALTTSTGASA